MLSADADNVNSKERLRATGGVSTRAGAIVVGVSRAKGNMSLFSAEAEDVAAREATEEVLLVRGYLKSVPPKSGQEVPTGF